MSLKKVINLDKDLGDSPEKALHHPEAPWREGSYEQPHGTVYPDLAEEPTFVKNLKERFPSEILAFQGYRGDAVVLAKPQKIVEILEFLRDDAACSFGLLMDLFGVDNLKTEDRQKEFAACGLQEVRFEVIYHVYSLRYRYRLRLRVGLSLAACEVDTISPLYKAADWFEREVWDMYGISFRGHPNLRRILNHEAFEGHPLRKDYPVNRRHNLITPTDL